MASGTQRDIDKIDNILEMGDVMKLLGISCEGLETLGQMKEAAKTTLHRTSKKPSWSAGEVTTNKFVMHP